MHTHTHTHAHKHTHTASTRASMWAQVPIIEGKGKFKFERIGAPQPQDMARISAERAMEMLREVESSVVPYFM